MHLNDFLAKSGEVERLCRADQLSREQRRNAINAEEKENIAKEKETKKEKQKKTKEEKEEKRRRKEEKKARRKSSEENATSLNSPANILSKQESGRLSPSSSCSDVREITKDCRKSSLCPPTSPPSASNSSPASILKDERALERHKSLKRVSFEEQPDIIDDREASVEVEVAVGGNKEEDIPAFTQNQHRLHRHYQHHQCH